MEMKKRRFKEIYIKYADPYERNFICQGEGLLCGGQGGAVPDCAGIPCGSGGYWDGQCAAGMQGDGAAE